MDYHKYDDIRPLLPHEIPSAIARLLDNEALRATYESLRPSLPWTELPHVLAGCDSIDEFKRRFSAHLVRHVMRHTCSSVAPLRGTEHVTQEDAYTYVSNHRDIILDGAFLNVLLYDAGAKFPQIAIGDNLIVQPWVEELVKLNGNFLVRRNLQGREVLLAARQLSEYMHDAVAAGTSVWIAQREGRAKDSRDLTQPALLKMLAIGAHERDIRLALHPLNIVPVSCSYEYDPCDYLKAREMQLKRDLPDYRKTKEEDTLNMRTGVLGFKGRVSFALGRPLRHILSEVEWEGIDTARYVEHIARLIDREIHSCYMLLPINYIAWDRLEGGRAHADHYTSDDEATFEHYLQERIALIKMPEGIEPDVPFLTTRILEMYANPAINHHIALDDLAATNICQ